MVTTDDRELAKNAAARPADFESFFRDNYLRLLRAMFLMIGDCAQAEDHAQEAMVRVFERWERVSRMESPDGYLYRIAMNLHRNRLRRLSVVTRRMPHAYRIPDATPVMSDASRDLQHALAGLPTKQRQVLVLSEWLGFDTNSIARTLGTKPASVRSLRSRALARMRERIGEGYD